MSDKDYKNFNADDFLQDEFFLQWMRNDDPEISRWWAAWSAGDTDRRNVIAEAQRKYRLFTLFKKFKVTDSEQRQVWQNIVASINYPRKKIFRLNSLQWVAAAAACLLLAIGLFVYRYQDNGTAFTIVATDNIKNVILADGTHIMLNKGAILKRYSKVNRQVWISGQAYFEVNKVKDAAKRPVPFLVHASQFEVKVTGTTFVVTSRPDSKSIVLTEGRVAVTSGKTMAEMRPGDRVVLNNGRFAKEKVNTSLYNAWKDPDFTFNNTSLSDLKILVHNVYGLEVIIRNEGGLKHRILNGMVGLSSEEGFTKTIEVLLDANVRHAGNQLIITPNQQ